MGEGLGMQGNQQSINLVIRPSKKQHIMPLFRQHQGVRFSNFPNGGYLKYLYGFTPELVESERGDGRPDSGQDTRAPSSLPCSTESEQIGCMSHKSVFLRLWTGLPTHRSMR